MMFEEKKTAKELRKFGLTMAAAFGVFSALVWYAEKTWFVYLAALAVFFIVFGVVCPKFLSPVEKYWMIFGEKVSVVMTVIILSITFYVVVTPLGLFLKVIGKDLLGIKIDKSKKSYWLEVEKDGPSERHLKPY